MYIIIPEGIHSFCVVRTYHFCASLDCISRKPLGSNLSTPPVVVAVSGEIGPGIVEQAIEAAESKFWCRSFSKLCNLS